MRIAARPFRRVALVAGFLMLSAPAFGQVPSRVTVNEKEMAASFEADQIRLRIPVINRAAALTGRLRLAILNADDGVVSSRDVQVRVAPGRTAISVSLKNPQAGAPTSAESPLLWYRLAYRLSGEAQGEPFAKGIVALAALAPDLFELRTAYHGQVVPGQTYEARVRAINPASRRPVAGVMVRATVVSEDAGHDIALPPGTTGRTGDVVLRWEVPASVKPGDAELQVEARKGSHLRRQKIDLTVRRMNRVVLSTDKVLYQPGQALHARALVVNTATGRTVAGAGMQFTLTDPDNAVLLRAVATTNEFGIGSVDWQLPATVRLGDYLLEVHSLDPDGERTGIGGSRVRIRRYELPTFTVSARADRAYYLAQQNAEVTVSATYLFGKPVTRGAVRLVRETRRSWNFGEQKWETREEQAQESALDAQGHAKFTVDLAFVHAQFAARDWGRYEDVRYAAFVTDATSGRTEQRRFELRVTRDPIHLYVSGVVRVGNLTSFYVTASYPDGSPAEVDLQIGQVAGRARRQALRSVRTNRYGAAKVTGLRLLAADEAAEDVTLVLDARDRAGAFVHYEQPLWSRDRDIDLWTDKTLYREAEPIKVSARSTLAGTLIVEVKRRDGVVASARVTLHNGSGFTVIPYRSGFQGELRLTAYSLDAPAVERWAMPVGAHTVLYPRDTDLRVNLRTERRSYQPGDDVAASVRVESPSGARQSSALGVVVVDKAIEERARTDEEFGGVGSGFWDWSWWADEASIGGVSRRDLEKLDLSEEVPDDLDLAAEVLLNAWNYGDLPEIEADDYADTTVALFRSTMQRSLSGFREAMDRAKTLPTTDAELAQVLAAAGVRRDALTDPWGTPYTYAYSLDGAHMIVSVRSAGPDKQPGTADDIDVTQMSRDYFAVAGNAIDAAVKDVYARSNACIRDVATLRRELLGRGVDLDALRDPLGGQYLFDFQLGFDSRIDASLCEIVVRTRPSPSVRNEATVWTSSLDYFANARARLDEAARAAVAASRHLPRNDEDLDRVLERTGFDLRKLRDLWQHPYHVTYPRTADYGQEFVYSSEVTGDQATPVTRALEWVKVWSPGPDGIAGTPDDIQVAAVSQLVGQQTAADRTPRAVTAAPPLIAGTGAVEGIVKDVTGAVLPGVPVMAKPEAGDVEFSATTSADGRYAIRNLPPGLYRLEVALQGFVPVTVRQVPVVAATVTSLNITLRVAAATETVTVNAESPAVATHAAAVATTASGEAQTPARTPISTPRLRDYFPETLYWAPSLVTDASGTARLKFTLADSITTWKMSIVASTKTGEVGAADAEIVAFQPFFVDHDPPKVLTVGDEIDLPVVVRNYLVQPQPVDVEMKTAEWFSLRGGARQHVEVPAGDSGRVVFPMTALRAVERGAQQVSATGRGAGDRVEKPVNVHPDGEERTATAAALLRESVALTVNVPADAIPGSAGSTLKIYPNVLAHVVESIEEGMRRPWGCAEQAISSTYPSVLLLEYEKQGHPVDAEASRRARRYTRAGIERLLGYRNASGGFGYWGHDRGDPALTAYAIRFLTDASDFVPVEANVLESAFTWLLSQQRADGSWQPRYGGDQTMTAYVAYTMARTLKRLRGEALRKSATETVRRALRGLAPPREPYALALQALTAAETGDEDGAARAAARLGAFAHREAGAVYWALETNTPFYGWGTTGRIEATAMVVRALATIKETSPDRADLVDGGLMFLLRQKDRFGIWYSGQATVDVLEALLAGFDAGRPSTAVDRTVVVINGEIGPSLDVPPAAVAAAPVFADISRWMKPGANTIEVRHGGKSGYASVQVVSTYFVPWASRSREAVVPGDSRALRLAVDFDSAAVQAGDRVQCRVEAERIGHVGYGMMLAEVGLPPGADVDRASLDRAVSSSGWSVSAYEVQPDRVVFYLWPGAGGTRFTFDLRLRFAMKARTGPSILYDYYNPEARVTVAPVDFRVQSETAGPDTSSRRP